MGMTSEHPGERVRRPEQDKRTEPLITPAGRDTPPPCDVMNKFEVLGIVGEGVVGTVRDFALKTNTEIKSLMFRQAWPLS
ncbi:unnamed protein product [Arctogadus glacialis]